MIPCSFPPPPSRWLSVSPLTCHLVNIHETGLTTRKGKRLTISGAPYIFRREAPPAMKVKKEPEPHLGISHFNPVGQHRGVGCGGGMTGHLTIRPQTTPSQNCTMPAVTKRWLRAKTVVGGAQSRHQHQGRLTPTRRTAITLCFPEPTSCVTTSTRSTGISESGIRLPDQSGHSQAQS